MRNNWFISGIRFNDFMFTEPTRLADWTPPKFAGIFVILAGDPNWAPKSFQPLCFGEFGNNSQQPILQSDCGWSMNIPGAHSLHVAVLPMPYSTTAQRWAVRNELVSAYNPVCQTNAAGSGDLSHRVAELEKKNHEQTAQVLMLQSNMNRLFAPQPVPPHRPIGFLSEPSAGTQLEQS